MGDIALSDSVINQAFSVFNAIGRTGYFTYE